MGYLHPLNFRCSTKWTHSNLTKVSIRPILEPGCSKEENMINGVCISWTHIFHFGLPYFLFFNFALSTMTFYFFQTSSSKVFSKYMQCPHLCSPNIVESVDLSFSEGAL